MRKFDVNFKLGIAITVFSLVILFRQSSIAAEKGPPLFFPARLNNIQVLPQKFEYSLRDAYRFLLGNRIIDTSNFEFIIKPTQSSVEIEMRWPQNLFETGTLSILNPSGVAVWSAPLKDNQNFLNFPDANSLLTRLLGLSFFKYCISQYELSTGMEVCSPELVVKGAGNKIKVDAKPYPNKPNIQINGRSVTPHGIVFLNDEKESLSFRAISASGAEFKMDTRSINLDYVDVIDLNETLMAVTIKGPYPLAPASYKILKDDLWTITLKKERAQIYIAGEGKVPLRQEFVVQGTLPKEENRFYLDKSSPTHAYASSLELRGWAPIKGTPQASDSASDVSVGGNRFTWSLKNLSVGQNKMSTIQVVDGKDTFTAGYEFSRQYANRLELLLGMNTEDTILYFGGEAQMWFESFPIMSEFTQQKIGLGLIYNQDLTGDLKTMLAEFDIYWRLKKGLQFLDPTFLIGLGIQNWTFDSQSLQTLAPFVGWVGPSFKKLKLFDWQEFYLKQSLTGKSGSLELKSRTEIKWKLYQPLKKNETNLRYTVGFYAEEAADQRSGALLEAAWMMVF